MMGCVSRLIWIADRLLLGVANRRTAYCKYGNSSKNHNRNAPYWSECFNRVGVINSCNSLCKQLSARKESIEGYRAVAAEAGNRASG